MLSHSRKIEGANITTHMIFHLIPIARKKAINPISVGGGQMSDVTNAINWDMWKRYANPNIRKKMFKFWRINQRKNYFLQHHVSQPTNLQKIGL